MKSKVYLGIYLLISLLFLCTVPVIVFYSSIHNEIIRILFYIGASGGIGGSIYSIRGFYQNIGGQTFKTNWIWWYIFRPIISVVSGVFAYFLIVGGLMSINNNPDVTFSKGVMFYCALAFLAGYSFTKFLEKVESISDNIFSKNDKLNIDNTNTDNHENL